jgi:hypothetical protein
VGVIYTADNTHASQNTAIDGAESLVEALVEALVEEWVLLHIGYLEARQSRCFERGIDLLFCCLLNLPSKGDIE